MWHKFVPRNNREGMVLFWVFVEPAAQLAILLILLTLVGRAAGYGTSFALFLLTGISTLHLFNSTSTAVKNAVATLESPRRLATVGVFTPAIAALGFRFTVGVVSAIALGYGVVVWQHLHGVPYDFLTCLEAFVLTALLAFGMGLIRGYSRLFMPVFERVYAIFSRVLLFISGVFYVPSFLPPAFRELLAWNPVLHAIDWVRTGVYSGYPELILSRGYFVAFVLGSVALGCALIWHDRRRILQ
ncbi:ABC transporter permease [Limibaculum sp. M0105]|uniref:ABC transporter permease n=1 Tax=Thermohalobaculum xanthum TaxID=2753746 RepID=A0A8J7SHX4_9RHOB|nr:ABC transporter permease [Thermohalobaculum xanthum]MBK0399980.1 ABC transporter permease [Thermohalobaculum xanthum]